MNITLYNNLSEKNVIQKTLANAVPLTGTLKESTSVKNPIITIEYPPTIVGYNYCYIEEFADFKEACDACGSTTGFYLVDI